jgi:hypothetical protein
MPSRDQACPSTTSSRSRLNTIYQRSRPSCRVDAVHRGNAFDPQTRGVCEDTLLSPSDAVDLARPVRVTVNGRPVHDAAVTPDLTTPLKWSTRDNDRTMLYGAELRIVVP